jgi:2-isopropylmalate synthase
MSDETVTPESERFKLVSLTAHSETGEQPFARVVISDNGREARAEARGGGPVDATFRAIESIVQSDTELQLYSVNNVTEGTDSQGEVTVRLDKDGRIVNGMGSDTDIVVASAKAYINALNKMASKSERVNPQYGEARTTV